MTKKERKNDLINFFNFFKDNGKNFVGTSVEKLVDAYIKKEATKK